MMCWPGPTCTMQAIDADRDQVARLAIKRAAPYCRRCTAAAAAAATDIQCDDLSDEINGCDIFE